MGWVCRLEVLTQPVRIEGSGNKGFGFNRKVGMLWKAWQNDLRIIHNKVDRSEVSASCRSVIFRDCIEQGKSVIESSKCHKRNLIGQHQQENFSRRTL